MRNKSSNVQVTKKRLSKCEEVFRSYSDIQLQYANLLESDDSILEFKCNVVLDDFELDGTYTTDFLITKTSGEILIRENKPSIFNLPMTFGPSVCRGVGPIPQVLFPIGLRSLPLVFIV